MTRHVIIQKSQTSKLQHPVARVPQILNVEAKYTLLIKRERKSQTLY
jgi:hypothetical protein